MRLIEGDDEQLQVYNEDFALALICIERNSSTKILSSRERSTLYGLSIISNVKQDIVITRIRSFDIERIDFSQLEYLRKTPLMYMMRFTAFLQNRLRTIGGIRDIGGKVTEALISFHDTNGSSADVGVTEGPILSTTVSTA